MSDDLIYCPKCGEGRSFIRKKKFVRDFELSKDDIEEIYVICCETCEYPIGAYPVRFD